MIGGYCEKYRRPLSKKDMRRKGCRNRKKQKRYSRTVCKHLLMLGGVGSGEAEPQRTREADEALQTGVL